MPFELSMWKLAVLGIIAMIVFGPERLPEIARDAGRILRQLRGMAQAARTELQSELGDTLGDFDIAELNPKTFVRKHLFEDDATPASASPRASPGVTETTSTSLGPLTLGEHAPYDRDAT